MTANIKIIILIFKTNAFIEFIKITMHNINKTIIKL